MDLERFYSEKWKHFY